MTHEPSDAAGSPATELRHSEQQLARRSAQLEASEALKTAIVDNALAALVSTDAAGRIVEFNPAAEAMFGRRRAAALGCTVGELLVPPGLRARHDAGMRRMHEGGAPRVLGKRVEMRALRADGSDFPIDIVLWRTDVRGEAFYTASIVDVTERHQAAQQIERQREALRQSEKLTVMGSLLAGVAHELNNPLSIVMGRAGLLEEKCTDDELRADVRRIREAAERCGRIVRTFLDMARHKPASRSKVALNPLVRAAADMLQYGLRSHGIELELALDESEPDVLADADQIGQVVLNLLINAQQAHVGVPGEHRAVRVFTGIERTSGRVEGRASLRVVVRVSDNGPGVSPALRARIFDPFFTTSTDGNGTGMGLTMSRTLAREQGGDLVLEDTPTGGASFCLSLPLADDARTCSAAAAPPAAAAALARVLVVDDEPEIAHLMREMLESAGYDVATAESGLVALELLDTARFDAVVCDLRMPDIDGAALWRELSLRAPALAKRTLFVTGDTLSPDARQFLRRAGCRGLDKPFSKADLLARVAGLLA
jgi:PAS domain S-box-containing protein